tara:strand:- start:19 stop:963 length:945 start_codon:yes stop_codon:yes gene_type:complete
MKNKLDFPVIYLNKINEDWVVDRFRNEWYENNKSISTGNIYRADLVWLIASWNWKKVSSRQLLKKKVLCTVHHIDEDKFNEKEKEEFFKRDEYVDEYHVISKKTYQQVSKLTQKKITVLPFWVNRNIWYKIKNNKELKIKYNLKEESFLVGSFQRDSEGANPNQPKLSKGPDRFLEVVKDLNNKHKNLHIVLTGKRRDYLVNELKKYQINYSYFEMANFGAINELYNCLDLYIVSSRYEGGPQSILECGVTKTPIISTDVGIASEILSPESIYDMNNFSEAKPNVGFAFNSSIEYASEKHFDKYFKMLKEVYEG